MRLPSGLHRGAVSVAFGAEAKDDNYHPVPEACKAKDNPLNAMRADHPKIPKDRVVILEDADDAFYSQFARALGRELQALDAARSRAGPGMPRLRCLLALSLASLAIAGHEREIARFERELLAELGQQILGDGGHVTRNPEDVLDALLEVPQGG